MPLYKGSGVALVTPFDSQLEINQTKFAELIEFQITNGIQALFPVGTTGESAVLSASEKATLYKLAVQQVKGRIPVIAGAGANDTRVAVELTKSAVEAGVDGILAVTPYYNKGNDSGILHYYKSIAEAAQGRPVAVYNVPGRTGVHLSIKLLKEIAQIPNITMLKEASGNMSYAVECAREVPELDLFSGNDDITVPMMSIGGLGVCSVSANIIPAIIAQTTAAFLKGDLETAKSLQVKYNDLNNIMFVETNPAPVKEALNLMGMKVGACRMPLGPISGESIEKLKAILKLHGVIS
ncbi:MAG: 4-hydroxy-tetrahydrodipicolinate synthase [Brevinema sp.]